SIPVRREVGREEKNLHPDRRAALSTSAGSAAGGPLTSSQNTGTLCTRLPRRAKSSRFQVGESGRQLGSMRVTAAVRRAGEGRGAGEPASRRGSRVASVRQAPAS